MASLTFTHISVFEKASAESQLRCLIAHVMEGGYIAGQEKDRFNDRLARYAHKAGITVQQARTNVREGCDTQYRLLLGSFGLV